MDNYIQPFVALCLNALLATLLREYGGYDMSKAELQNWDAVSSVPIGSTEPYNYRHSTSHEYYTAILNFMRTVQCDELPFLTHFCFGIVPSIPILSHVSDF
jgi:hypothetical protein